LEDVNEAEKKDEEIKETEETKETKKETEEEKKVSDWMLVASVVILILIIGVIIGLRFFRRQEVMTVRDMHLLNLDGKLKPEEGYIYNGYSFVYANGLWYTQVQTASGTSQFDIPLHYGPEQLEDVPVEGELNYTLLDSVRGVYVTFDPLGPELQYVALAVGEFDQSITKAFNKLPVAACDRNETTACAGRPIITCNNTKNPVFYLQQEPEARVILDNNCMIVQGIGPEIVRATNRLLLGLYGIMP